MSDFLDSLRLGKLSARASNIITLTHNGFDSRDALIEAVKSRRLLNCRNCGVQTYNEIATAIGLQDYCLKDGANVGRILWKLKH